MIRLFKIYIPIGYFSGFDVFAVVMAAEAVDIARDPDRMAVGSILLTGPAPIFSFCLCPATGAVTRWALLGGLRSLRIPAFAAPDLVAISSG